MTKEDYLTRNESSRCEKILLKRKIVERSDYDDDRGNTNDNNLAVRLACATITSSHVTMNILVSFSARFNSIPKISLFLLHQKRKV